MRELTTFVAVAALCVSSSVQLAAGQGAAVSSAAAQPQTGIVGSGAASSRAQISGRVLSPNGDAIGNATVRARNLLSGETTGFTSTAASGQYSLLVNPGSYMLEVVDASGQIIGTSAYISAAPGSILSATTVTVRAGALGVPALSAGFFSTLMTTAVQSVTYAAAAAGIAGVVMPPTVDTASPSR